MAYDEALRALEAGKAGSGLHCAEVRDLLTGLGFVVKDGKRGGHKTVTHPSLPSSDFISTGYNCQGGNGIVDRNYLGQLVRVVRSNKDTLKRLLGEDDQTAKQ